MVELVEEKLLSIAETDDLKAFNALMEEMPCGGYRLGRFPVLSVLYLFGARKILVQYEEKFLKVTSWEELREPTSLAKLFSEKAGKCLRLYLSEIVSPLEMLLILDKTKQLKNVFPIANTSNAVKQRLQTIYAVKYSLEIKYEGKEIILDRRPLNRKEKKKILAVCLACFFGLALIVAASVTSVVLMPKAGEVTKLSHIDFGSETTYTLKKDITVPDNFKVKEVNCTIVGDGKSLIIGKNASLGELNGKMSDLRIHTTGSPIFTVCNTQAELSNVTVNVTSALELNEDNAFIALTNYGTFDGVTLNVSGKLSALAGDMDGTEELIFGGMVVYNHYTHDNESQHIYGTIKNCTVNYSNFTLTGELHANASYGGIVAVNSGIVQDCKITGKITADTFDLAGACYVNTSLLSRIVNEAALTQNVKVDGWTALVGGIVIENASHVEYCNNTGNLTVDASGAAYVGGILARTYGYTYDCISSGNIVVMAQIAHVGGIFGRSEVVSDGWHIYCGSVTDCISEANIYVMLGEGTSCIGGIGGFVNERKFTIVDEHGDVVEETVYFSGGITNCVFLGELDGNNGYIGNIVGVCGSTIYEANSYTSGNAEYPYFDGNYHLDNGLPAFGATVANENEEEIFTLVEGKGATEATEADIKKSSVYQNIMNALGL